MATKVYSTSDIKFHGKNPFCISERLVEEGKVIIKSSKTIIRKGKTKVVEESTIQSNKPITRADKAALALHKLESLFDQKSQTAKNKHTRVQIGETEHIV